MFQAGVKGMSERSKLIPCNIYSHTHIHTHVHTHTFTHTCTHSLSHTYSLSLTPTHSHIPGVYSSVCLNVVMYLLKCDRVWLIADYCIMIYVQMYMYNVYTINVHRIMLSCGTIYVYLCRGTKTQITL